MDGKYVYYNYTDDSYPVVDYLWGYQLITQWRTCAVEYQKYMKWARESSGPPKVAVPESSAPAK